MPDPGGDEGGGAQARVNVLAELPLLEARLDAPSLRISDVDQSQVHHHHLLLHACQALHADVERLVSKQWLKNTGYGCMTYRMSLMGSMHR